MEPNPLQFSIYALGAAAFAGFIVGRITAGWNDPRRAEEKRQQARKLQEELEHMIRTLKPESANAVRAHMKRNEIIQAVKLVRDELGCGLKDAKDIVERIAK